MATCYRLGEEYELAIQEFNIIIKQVKEKTTILGDDQQIYDKAIVGLSICLVNTCQWQEYQILKDKVIELCNNSNSRNDDLLKPFEALLLDLPQELIERCSLSFARSHIALASELNVQHCHTLNHQRIKIGYCSPDFGMHPVGLFAGSLLPYHDKNKFEVYCLSLKQYRDDFNAQVRQGVEHYIDLSTLTDQEIIDKIQDLEIDILIDLSGGTRHARYAVTCAKAAPIQCHWMGYVTSQFNEKIDYYITTEKQAPESSYYKFMEKKIYLPETMLALDTTLPHFQMSHTVKRSDYQLPENKFIFCCFNQIYRFDVSLFQAWFKILMNVPNSILWLGVDQPLVKNKLHDYFEKMGIDKARIIFRPTMPLTKDWHHQLADLYLDTFKESGATTNILSQIANLPVISIEGPSPHNKMGSSLLYASQLEACVAKDTQDYIEKAIFYGTHPDALANLKDTMSKNRKENMLFNPRAVIKNLENALTKAWQSYLSHSPTTDIKIT